MLTPNEIEAEDLLCSECGVEVSSYDINCPNCGSEFKDNEKYQSAEIEQGRKLARVIMGSVLAVLFIIGIFDLADFDIRSWTSFFIRLALTILMFRLFYQGIKGAKYIMIVLLGIAGLYGIFMGVVYMSKTLIGLLPVVIGLLYIVFSIILIKSNSIKLFQEFQRKIRQKNNGNYTFWIMIILTIMNWI
jgi:hypothetical protein